MADSNLYKVLSGLSVTDNKLWTSIKSLSSALSGDIDALESSLTSLVSSTSGVLDTRITTEVNTLTGTIDEVSGIVDDKETAINEKIQGISGIVDDKETAINGTIETVSSNLKQYTDDQIEDLSGTVSGKLEALTAGAATYQLSAITTTTGYASTYQLIETKNGTSTPLTNSIINIPKDQLLSSAWYDAATEKLKLVFQTTDGTTATETNTVDVPVSDLVHEYIGGNGITVGTNDENDNHHSSISVKLDNSTEPFLTVGSDGLKLSGVQAAITAASDAATAGLTALSGRMDTAEAGLSALSGRMTTAEGDIDDLQAALADYTGADAVKTKFAEVDGGLAGLSGRMDTAEAGLSALSGRMTTAEGDIDTAEAGLNYLSSVLTDYLEPNAVSGKFAAVDNAIASIQSATTGGLSGVADNTTIVVGTGTAQQVKTSGIAIKDSTEDGMNPDSDEEVPTSKAVADYVNAGLDSLITNISNLQAQIEELNV